MKQQLSKLPVIGFFLRFINTFLHLNNLKFRVFTHQKQIELLELSLKSMKESMQLVLEEKFQFQKRIELLEQSRQEEKERIELLEQSRQEEKERIELLEQSRQEEKERIELLEKLLNENIALIKVLTSNLEQINGNIDKSIATQIYYQLHSLQYRIDILESSSYND